MSSPCPALQRTAAVPPHNSLQVMDGAEESKLTFSLDRHDEGPKVAFSKDKPGAKGTDLGLGMDLGLELSQGQRSQTFRIPHSPSSPGSLADLSAVSADVLITSNLVKSSSTELKPRESGSLRPKPLLSLVKSLSTEISRRGEPEVNLSKSDSKLHMHPWKQFTQHRIPEARPELGRENEDDVWTSPPSPGSMSPTESRSSSLIAEFEDTRRKFSEAMQDPLSMFSKIMGDEGSGSPRQGRGGSGAGDSPASQGSCGKEGSWTPVHGEDGGPDTPPRCRRRADGEHGGACDMPRKRPRKSPLKPSRSPPPHAHGGDGQYEICAYRDILQVVEMGGRPGGARRMAPARQRRVVPGTSAPLHWLLCVGLLTYGFLVLPLPSYLTGLLVGLACGFLLGLAVVFLFAPRHSAGGSGRGTRSERPGSLCADPPLREPGEADVLEGWMNEMQSYDPESFQPSLTHSVHASLEGGRLRLAYPRANVPRRAAFDETPHEAVFVRFCTYQLANCKVSLLPAMLARKRVWNKKYPICIVLAEGEAGEEVLLEEPEDEQRTERETSLAGRPLPLTLYLFGRTGREKEEWFQHFLSASRTPAQSSPGGEEPQGETLPSVDAVKGSTEELPGASKVKVPLDYSAYMSLLIGPESGSATPSPCHSSDQGGAAASKRGFPDEERAPEGRPEAPPGEELRTGDSFAEGQPAWVNSLVGRVFWDFLREKYWSDQVAHKIQKKLTKIRLPYFMNELTLAELNTGTCLPQVLSISRPSLDRRGLWLDLEVLYSGSLQMTLETKMNLCKLGKEAGPEEHSVLDNCQVGWKPRLSVLADSDEESSSAGSSDEDDLPPSEPPASAAEKSTGVADGNAGGSTSRKILRFMDKIAKSKYFQKATENEFIKKKIAEVSNVPLMLTVEVLELSGTLAVNIPPPPTDRIWYSFRVPPALDLHVRPMLGEREVTFTHVTEWIEKKLQCEFQKVFVMPNMDDLYLPLMTPGLDVPPPSHPSAPSSSRQSSVESQEYLSE